LNLLAGHVADRYDRALVMRACQAAEALATIALALGSQGAWFSREWILSLIVLTGTARAFEFPATQAFLPSVAPEGMLQQAVAAASSATQSAVILGPALGGLIYIGGATAVYFTCASLFAAAALFNTLNRVAARSNSPEPASLRSMFAGIRFVRNRPVILGAISLDLFAVLLGGATALMPIFARDILHTGPWGLGVLRSMPAVGALTMSLVLMRRPLQRSVGRMMFAAVMVFGVATVVFAVSRSMGLSLVSLFVLGASDMISVVIRQSLVQLGTPDAMRGRVSAINGLFIGASNQLGEFESGLTAAWFGTVPAAVLGGTLTIVIALAWIRFFPQLAQRDTLVRGTPE
jgi:MFS family permease